MNSPGLDVARAFIKMRLGCPLFSSAVACRFVSAVVERLAGTWSGLLTRNKRGWGDRDLKHLSLIAYTLV